MSETKIAESACPFAKIDTATMCFAGVWVAYFLFSVTYILHQLLPS